MLVKFIQKSDSLVIIICKNIHKYNNFLYKILNNKVSSTQYFLCTARTKQLLFFKNKAIIKPYFNSLLLGHIIS
jgi:hypothetical protein